MILNPPPCNKEQSNRSEIVRSLIYYVHYYIIINIILSFSLKERKNNIYYLNIIYMYPQRDIIISLCGLYYIFICVRIYAHPSSSLEGRRGVLYMYYILIFYIRGWLVVLFFIWRVFSYNNWWVTSGGGVVWWRKLFLTLEYSIRKLSLNINNSILLHISLMQVGLLSKVCSFSKLIRMICVILSFQIGSNLVALSFSKALTFVSASSMGIILVKKTAFNLVSYNRFKCCLTIRV